MKRQFVFFFLLLIAQNIFSISYGKNISEDSLLVFVGDIKSVTLIQKGNVSFNEDENMDESSQKSDIRVVGTIVATKNKFSVESIFLKRLWGRYNNEIIKFNLYDEFDYPMIKNFKHALFIVKKNKDNNWNQVKWLYYDVYETTKGDWIVPYLLLSSIVDKEFFENNMKPIELKEGEYIKKSSFNDAGISEQEILKYYRIDGDKAIPKYGISVDVFWQYFSKERMPKIKLD